MSVPDAATKRLIAKILGGQHDADLELINDALNRRTADIDGPNVYWRFCLDGIEASEEDLLVEEAAMWEDDCQIAYRALIPRNLAKVDLSLVRVLYKTRGHLDADAVADKMSTLTTSQLRAAFTTYVKESAAPLA